MHKQLAATLPASNQYDDCRITACLKSLFKSTKAKAETGFIVRESISEIRKELELLNKGAAKELSYDYLAALEHSLPGTSFRYVVVSKNNKPVLFAYFQLFTLTSKNFSLEKNTGFVRRILRFFLDLKKVSVVILGNALRNETPSFSYDETSLSKDEAAELIASAGEKIASDDCASALILKDIPASAKIRKWLTAAGFGTPWKDMVMTMDVNDQWTTIDDYVQSLSRKYKARAKKILESGNQLVIKKLSEDDIQHYKQDIHRLFRNVADSQPFVLAYPDANHFSSLKSLYKDEFELLGFFKGAQLIAFSTAFISLKAYDVYYVGFDYDLNAEYQLYFNLLFTGLERAIQLKKSQLRLGRTSFDAKASLGAKAVETAYFYKPGNIASVVSNWFANYFSTMEDAKWKLRNPLK